MTQNWFEARLSAWNNLERKPPLHDYMGMSKRLYQEVQENPPKFILGLDEVGYGSWAGPLVVGAVLAPFSWAHPDLRDSKSVKTEAKRGEILTKLRSSPGAKYFVHRTSVEEIDQKKVHVARLDSFTLLVKELSVIEPDTLVVIDGNVRVRWHEHVALPKADSIVPHVMAAAILAKVFRDTEMINLAKEYPQYGFQRHKGYGGDDKHPHTRALERYGPCPLHRRSYRPIQERLGYSTSASNQGSRA